jgi:Protein of unknown function (DUF3987)
MAPAPALRLHERRAGDAPARPVLRAADVAAALPASEDAERNVVLWVVSGLGDHALPELAGFLRPEHFFGSPGALGRVYGAALRVHRHRAAVNSVSVRAELERAGDRDALAALDWLTGWLPPEAEDPLAACVSQARTVAEAGTVRLVAAWAFRLARAAEATGRGEQTPAGLLAFAQDELRRLVEAAPPHLRPAGRAIRSFGSFSSGTPAAGDDEAPLPAVPALPLSCFPPAARDLIRRGAASLHCPPDFLATPLLAVTAGAIGRRFVLRVKQGFLVGPQVWTATVGEPGTGKSPALEAVRAPLDVLQAEAIGAHRAAKDAHEQRAAEWAALPSAERRDAEKPEPPPDLEHYFTSDATLEAICKILGGEHSRTSGLVVFPGEIAKWVNGFDAYRGGRGGDRDNWLDSWAGAAIKSDRTSREPYYVPRPVVAVTGGIQPDRLRLLASEVNDGFFDRFLVAYPDDQVADWSYESVPEATVRGLAETFRAFRRDVPDERETVDLSAEARTLYVEWFNHNAAVMRVTGGPLRGFYAKLPGQVARLTLILHCLEHGAGSGGIPVASTTVDHAISLGDYFIAHAVRALARMGKAALGASSLAGRVLAVFRDAGPARALRKGELHRKLGAHVPAERLGTALAELVRLGCIVAVEAEPSGRAGRRPEAYRLAAAGVPEENEPNELIPDDSDGDEPDGEAPA